MFYLKNLAYGLFKKSHNGLQYLGGEGRTFNGDPHELCWFYLEKLAKKCGPYMKIKELCYLIPVKSLDEG